MLTASHSVLLTLLVSAPMVHNLNIFCTTPSRMWCALLKRSWWKVFQTPLFPYLAIQFSSSYRSRNPNVAGGGIVVYVKSSIPAVPFLTSTSHEYLRIQINLPEKPLFLCCL